MARIGGTILAASFALAAQGATIEVTVVEDGGGTVPGQVVQLSAKQPGTGVLPMHRRTALGGRALFEDVRPGTYEVALGIPARGFVDAAANPLQTPRQVTVSAEDERIALELRIRRGLPVVARLLSGKTVGKTGSLALAGERSGTRFEVALAEGAYRELTLPPDRWRALLSPPEGWTVVGSELNGGSWRDGSFELTAESPTTFLEWTIAAPGRIEGKVVSGLEVLPSVLLERLAPGPWAQAQEAAGREVPVRLVASTDFQGAFAADLPDGRWRVRPLAFEPRVRCTARPELLEVEVPAGGTMRVDFEFQCEEDGSPEPNLIVQAVTAEGKPLPEADVRVLLAGSEEEVTHGRRGSAAFTLPAGSYRVIASHPDFLDGATELPDFEPADRPKHVEVRLREGATLRVQARDLQDAAVEGVHLRVEPRAGGRDRAGATDATGRVTFRGLEAGGYTLSAEMLEGATHRRALFGSGETAERTAHVTLGERASEEVEVRVFPAATLRARLACEGGEALPARTWARVVPGTLEVADAAAVAAAMDHPLLARVFPVSADGAVEIGPLDPGTVRLALRPAEFDRATWALGTEQADESAVLQIEQASGAVDLGTILIHCGPRACLSLDDEAPPVDLRVGRAEARGVVLEGIDPAPTTRPLAVRRTERSLEVLGLPAGMVELTVTLCSPSAPAPGEGEPSCSPSEGKRATPVQWTVRVPAAPGKVAESRVAWPWP